MPASAARALRRRGARQGKIQPRSTIPRTQQATVEDAPDEDLVEAARGLHIANQQDATETTQRVILPTSLSSSLPIESSPASRAQAIEDRIRDFEGRLPPSLAAMSEEHLRVLTAGERQPIRGLIKVDLEELLDPSAYASSAGESHAVGLQGSTRAVQHAARAGVGEIQSGTSSNSKRPSSRQVESNTRGEATAPTIAKELPDDLSKVSAHDQDRLPDLPVHPATVTKHSDDSVNHPELLHEPRHGQALLRLTRQGRLRSLQDSAMRELQYKHRHTFIGSGSLDSFLDKLTWTSEFKTYLFNVSVAFAKLAELEQVDESQESFEPGGWEAVSKIASEDALWYTTVKGQNRVVLGSISLGRFLMALRAPHAHAEIDVVDVVDTFCDLAIEDMQAHLDTKSGGGAFRAWYVAQQVRNA